MAYKRFIQDEVLDNGIIKGHMEWIKTNADRLKIMSEKELIDILSERCPPDGSHDFCQLPSSGSFCRLCWEQWLRKEADD